MKADRLIELTCHPEKMGSDDLRELDTLVNRYPYFQAGRVLYLKALHIFASVRFRNELKAGTIHIADHKQLYKYLNNLLEFDYLQPENKKENSSLSDIVTDRIKEINGYIPVNTVGVPAQKTPPDRLQQTEDETLIDINYQAQQTVSPPVSTVSGKPDTETISNPILLDGIPGIVNDYAQPEIVGQNKPVFEKVESHEYEGYIIEAVHPDKPVQPETSPESATDSEAGKITYTPIELIEEEFFIPEKEEPVEKETVKNVEKHRQPAITPKELPEIMGAYLLSDDPEEQEIPLGELAGELKKKRKKQEKENLIDKFINEEPSIPKGQLDSVDDKDLSEESSAEKEDLFSETLAKIYIKQKLYEKAIATYIKLSLKFPEKSVYFANRIEKIRENINNNE